MPTAASPLIRTATRDGSSGPSKDRIFVTDRAVIVLDGASHPDASERDGGWLAEHLGRELAHLAEARSGTDLGDVVGEAIETVADRFGLSPGTSPSTTVCMVQWSNMEVHSLVLGDSPIIVRLRDGRVIEVRDDQIKQVGRRDVYEAALAAGGFAAAHPDAYRTLIAEQQAARNREGGYWIAETVYEAGWNAEQEGWLRADVDTILLLTDGVADGVDVYGSPASWAEVIDQAAGDPQGFVDAVHAIEETDPQGTRWPRSKLHDDKALAVVQFTPSS